jgi:hypothetical protein
VAQSDFTINMNASDIGNRRCRLYRINNGTQMSVNRTVNHLTMVKQQQFEYWSIDRAGTWRLTTSDRYQI